MKSANACNVFKKLGPNIALEWLSLLFSVLRGSMFELFCNIPCSNVVCGIFFVTSVHLIEWMKLFIWVHSSMSFT
jgi:hypothetical protein